MYAASMIHLTHAMVLSATAIGLLALPWREPQIVESANAFRALPGVLVHLWHRAWERQPYGALALSPVSRCTTSAFSPGTTSMSREPSR